jgi:putative ABC transport system permease protein
VCSFDWMQQFWPLRAANKERKLVASPDCDSDLPKTVVASLENENLSRSHRLLAHGPRYFGGCSNVIIFEGIGSVMDDLWQDLRYAVRVLAKSPGFTIAAALSLALGIGVTTAIFTVLNAVALRPLPYPEAGKLLWMTQTLKKNSTDDVTITAHFLEWRRQNHVFTDLAGYNYKTRILTGLDEPLELRTVKASASLLPLLGVQPVLGRNFLKEEDYKGRDQVALLGYELWDKQFGRNPKIVGRSITLDGDQFAVVGILPEDFMFPGDPVQLVTPLGKDEAAELRDPQSIILNVIGRLRAGVTPAQAKAEMEVIQSRLPVPNYRPTISLKMLPLRTHLYGDAETAGLVLVAAAALLLLIGCANVSNLLLSRLVQRDKELAIRALLGASRARLMVQLVTESALLGVLACALGAVLGFWLRRPLFALSPYHLSGLNNLPFDGSVLGFAIAAGMLATLLFGLLPTLHATEIRLADAIKVGEASVIGGRGALRSLSLIAAGEIAIILILSTGTVLMLRSFWKMRYANLGFQPDHLVAATLTLSDSTYRDKTQQFAFIQQLLERAQNLPGVESAAVTDAGELPPGEWHATNTFAIEGHEQPLGGPRPIARYPSVSSSYFGIMGIALLQGRLFRDSDQENATPVAVVNQALAHRYFKDVNPIGKRIEGGSNSSEWREIVGVVEDVKTSGLAAAPEPTFYLPYRQTDGLAQIGLVVRSPLDAGIIADELRKTVVSLDPNQPVASVEAMGDRLTESVAKPRFATAMLGAFAGLAAVLGIIGVYGVMAYRLRWQSRELALRLALGAQRGDVVRFLLLQAFGIILPGLGLGLLGSALLSRSLSSMLYDVSANDPVTLAAVSGGLTAVALLASYFPARRAAKVDPMVALRYE